MSKLTVEDTSLVSVADAIRTKGGTTDALVFPDGFVSAIEGIQSGGGEGTILLTSLVDKSITEVTADMLKGCTKIGDVAFAYCSSLTTVNIPSGATSIGNSAFTYCSSLTTVNIPSGVTSIGSSSFSFCSSLTTVNIPSSVTTVKSNAFAYCSSLATVTMKPTTPPTLSTTSFRDCTALTTIIVPAGSLSAYQSATNWSAYADKMVEASS